MRRGKASELSENVESTRYIDLVSSEPLLSHSETPNMHLAKLIPLLISKSKESSIDILEAA